MFGVRRAVSEFVDDLHEILRETKRLKAENVMLREQGERLFDKTLELGAENAKLRELVWNLHACNGSCPRCIELMGRCEYDEQLREFGIEVDE